MLRGGPLSGEYQMLQLHFHWGGDDTRGSEHTIDGKEYPLEVGFRAGNEPSRSLKFHARVARALSTQQKALLWAFSVIVKLPTSPRLFLYNSV